MRILNPSNDYVFKILFKDPEGERRLIAMLTAILEPRVPIVSVRVLNPEIPADVVADKAIVLDLLIELEDKSSVDIEAMPRFEFTDRVLFYWSKAHARQLKRGDDFDELRPTISIAWMASRLPRARRIAMTPGRVHSRFRVQNVATNAELTDQLELHFLELSKRRSDATLSPALRRWARFFDRPSSADLDALASEDEIMADTVTKLRTISDDDQHARIADAREKGEVARRIGLGAAYREGEKRGVEKTRVAMAREMLRRGTDRAFVADLLGIPDAELDGFLAER